MRNFSPEQFKKRILIFLKNVKRLAKLINKCVIDKSLGKKTSRLGLTSLAYYVICLFLLFAFDYIDQIFILLHQIESRRDKYKNSKLQPSSN